MAHCAVNGGLESLAAEASRRAESLDLPADPPGPSQDVTGSKSASQSSGQKGKVRKAYTITKQRERWTDSEHDRFLQALKRYGRAWRKIEEHIGTKTAVQIRSHAQKFFSKLQREQSANGGTGDESSKAGISIPPPRPKRKPAHPYPRKTSTDSQTEARPGGQSQTQQPPGQPAASSPSATQPQAALPALPGLDGRPGEASLSQILEAAAVAAASAWSQVVASAGSKVQQQLQAHVMAQQGMQSAQPMLSGGSGLPSQRSAQQQPHTQARQHIAANLQSSSQHPMGRSPFGSASPRELLGAASAPHAMPVQAQSMQDSPDGAGNAADPGNDRDSACSKEYSRGRAAQKHAVPTGRQAWRAASGGGQHSSLSGRQLSQGGWEAIIARVQASSAAGPPWGSALGRGSWASNPARAFSAGAVLNDAAPAQQPKQQPLQPHARRATTDSMRSIAQSRSDTSQLANFYQQAAAEQQGDAENAEHGSSGDDGGSSGDGDGSNDKMGLMRSDKGSNTGNSGSDEDANGNGSHDAGYGGKGSDEGSNSPCARGCSSPPTSAKPSGSAKDAKVAPAALLRPLSGAPPQQALPLRKPDQPGVVRAIPTQRHGLAQIPALSPEALLAIQQQALAARAGNVHVPYSPSGGSSAFASGAGLLASQAPASQTPAPPTSPAIVSAGGDVSQGNRTSSGVPSMDTFAAHPMRSFSVPPGVATGSVCSHEVGVTAPQAEEASGFKPYNKRHGMPLDSLPPAKRFSLGSTGEAGIASPRAGSSGATQAGCVLPPPAACTPFNSLFVAAAGLQES